MKDNKKAKYYSQILIPSICLLLIALSVFLGLFLGCKKSNSPSLKPIPSPANVLDPSKSDWNDFYSATSGDFAPGTNGRFADDWETWIQGTNYDTLDLGAFSSIATWAFHPSANIFDPGLLSGDMKIKHLIFSNSTCASIREGAFAGCSSLTSVALQDPLISIGIAAFSFCLSLTSITLPNTLTFIEQSAFVGCLSLASVTLPNSLDSIGESAFQSCTSLTSVRLPDSLSSIAMGTFAGCSLLNSINLPNTLTSIGDQAFDECTSIRSLTLPNSLESIGDEAFSNCSSLALIVASYVEEPDWGGEDIFVDVAETGIVYNTNDSYQSDDFLYYLQQEPNLPDGWTAALVVPENLLTFSDDDTTVIGHSDISSYNVLKIPATHNGVDVTSVGSGAFNYCSSLISLTLPNSLTSIGNFAFQGCSSLTSITLPNSLTSIGSYAFGYYSSLTSITLTQVSGVDTPTFKLIDGTDGSPVTDGSPRNNAFLIRSSDIISGNINATCGTSGGIAVGDITIPSTIDGTNNITSIGESAFFDCSSLTSLSLPNSLTSIRNYAFYNCSSLTSLTLPNSLTAIDDNAFGTCSSLTSITLTQVSGVDTPTFKLIDGTDGSPVTEGSPRNNAFLIRSSDIISGNINATCGTEGGIAVGDITIPSTIDGSHQIISIDYDTFYECTSLTSIDLSNCTSLTSIGESAFNGCLSLTSVTLPDSLTSIGRHGFRNCSSLTSITLPNSLTAIGDNAFDRCSSLASITASYDERPGWAGEQIFYRTAPYGTVENTGALSSDDFLTYLQDYGIPNDGSWTVAP